MQNLRKETSKNFTELEDFLTKKYNNLAAALNKI